MILKYDDHGQPYEDPMEENKKLKERVKELESSLTTALEINDTYQRDNKKLESRIKELDNSLAIALDINDKYQRENVKLKKRAQEAEGEVTIVKGIGMNSPEMRAAHAEIDRLSEENTNLKTMMNEKTTSNSC